MGELNAAHPVAMRQSVPRIAPRQCCRCKNHFSMGRPPDHRALEKIPMSGPPEAMRQLKHSRVRSGECWCGRKGIPSGLRDRLNRLRNNLNFCHSEARCAPRNLSFAALKPLSRREILRFARNDKIDQFFPQPIGSGGIECRWTARIYSPAANNG